MQLICNYTIDPPRVVGHVASFSDVNFSDPMMRDCVVVPFPGNSIDEVVAAYGRAGPEPELLGDEPTKFHPDHAELDKHDVPDHVLGSGGKAVVDPKTGAPVPHPLRAVAGKPYTDNRRPAEDVRLPSAPPKSDPGVLRAYLAQQRWRREVEGIAVTLDSDDPAKVIEIPVATDRESQVLVEVSALRAARRADATFEFKGSDDEIRTLTAAQMIVVADSVEAHATRLRSAESRTRALIDSGEIKGFAEVDAGLET